MKNFITSFKKEIKPGIYGYSLAMLVTFPFHIDSLIEAFSITFMMLLFMMTFSAIGDLKNS